jgi:hypothetical protein
LVFSASCLLKDLIPHTPISAKMAMTLTRKRIAKIGSLQPVGGACSLQTSYLDFMLQESE